MLLRSVFFCFFQEKFLKLLESTRESIYLFQPFSIYVFLSGLLFLKSIRTKYAVFYVFVTIGGIGAIFIKYPVIIPTGALMFVGMVGITISFALILISEYFAQQAIIKKVFALSILLSLIELAFTFFVN